MTTLLEPTEPAGGSSAEIGLSIPKWNLPLSPEGVIVRCSDGGLVRIRPIRPTDKEPLKETFARLSPRSRQRRFFTQMNELPDTLAERLANIDHRLHRAWVVFDASHDGNARDREQVAGAGIAVARLVSLPDDATTAELALVVADDHQGRGIGRALMDLLLSTASVNGITTLTADTLRENNAMIRLMRERGAVADESRSEGGIVSYDLPVPEVDETAGALYDLIRWAT